MGERSDRGAAAVELALVLPVLVALLLGILTFGQAFHVQTALSNAARDAVRVMALQDPSAGAEPAEAARRQAIESAAPSVALTDSQIEVTIRTESGIDVPATSCDSAVPATATVTITHTPQLLVTGSIITLTGKGTMRCNG